MQEGGSNVSLPKATTQERRTSIYTLHIISRCLTLSHLILSVANKKYAVNAKASAFAWYARTCTPHHFVPIADNMIEIIKIEHGNHVLPY